MGAQLAERRVLTAPQTRVCRSGRQTVPKQRVGEGKSSQRTLEACALVRGCAGGEAAARVPSTPGSRMGPAQPCLALHRPGQPSRLSAALPRKAQPCLSCLQQPRSGNFPGVVEHPELHPGFSSFTAASWPARRRVGPTTVLSCSDDSGRSPARRRGLARDRQVCLGWF